MRITIIHAGHTPATNSKITCMLNYGTHILHSYRRYTQNTWDIHKTVSLLSKSMDYFDSALIHPLRWKTYPDKAVFVTLQ